MTDYEHAPRLAEVSMRTNFKTQFTTWVENVCNCPHPHVFKVDKESLIITGTQMMLDCAAKPQTTPIELKVGDGPIPSELRKGVSEKFQSESDRRAVHYTNSQRSEHEADRLLRSGNTPGATYEMLDAILEELRGQRP